jgi:hypothetical protein
MSDKEEEVRSRAKECFRKVLARDEVGVCIPAARVLARIAPEKAPAVLLGRLPFAWPDERDTIWRALSEVAARGGRLDAAYAKALSDKAAAGRALSGFLLARWGSEKERKAAAALLKDPDREVRLRVAQGLLGAGSTGGVPALIGLLSKRPEPVSWQAEELLRWWAGEDGPKPGSDWAAWWKGKPKVRPAKREYPPRLLLVVDGPDTKMRAWLCGCDGKPRWQMHWESKTVNRRDPAREAVSDVVLLPEDSLVVASEWSPTAMKDRPRGLGHHRDSGYVVTGRNLKGRVLWQAVKHEEAVKLWRLSAGTVLTDLGEVTPEGNQVRTSGMWRVRERLLVLPRGPYQLALPYRVGRRWLFHLPGPQPGQRGPQLVEVDEKDLKKTTPANAAGV